MVETSSSTEALSGGILLPYPSRRPMSHQSKRYFLSISGALKQSLLQYFSLNGPGRPLKRPLFSALKSNLSSENRLFFQFSVRVCQQFRLKSVEVVRLNVRYQLRCGALCLQTFNGYWKMAWCIIHGGDTILRLLGVLFSTKPPRTSKLRWIEGIMFFENWGYRISNNLKPNG